MKPRCWLAVLICLGATLSAAQEVSPPALLDPEQACQAERGNAVNYEVDFSLVVTAPYKTKKLRVWLPVPPSDFAQQVGDSRWTSRPISVEPRFAAEPAYGNCFAYFEFDSPPGAQIIRHQFQIKVWELRWRVDSRKVASAPEWPSSFDKYRRGDTQAVVVDARFEKLLGEIVPRRAAPFEDLTSAMSWMQDHVQYDHQDASLRADATHVLDKRRGHCSDYHSFCASLGRVIGLPTRVTYGINPFPKNSPSHCKLEAYLPPYGWVSFDVSETQKLVGLIRQEGKLDDDDKQALSDRALARLASGFRDNTWYLQTRGTDYDLAPKASHRVPVVRTAYIEADGVPLPDPDPADQRQRAFSWMTAHSYQADRAVPYPFSDWNTLAPASNP